MKRLSRFKDPQVLRREWRAYAALTILAGGVLLAAVFLPWANDNAPGWVNYSLAQELDLNGVLGTRWGVPALVLAAVTVGAGVAMLFAPARRGSVLLGALAAACGAGAFGVAQDAAAHIGFYDPGIGMFLTALVAVLLVPIGLVAALVAHLLVRAVRREKEPAT